MWQSNKAIDFQAPDNKAGASERAGFIDAPDIKAKKNICQSNHSTNCQSAKSSQTLLYKLQPI